MQSTRADREDRLRTISFSIVIPTAVHPAASGELAPGGVPRRSKPARERALNSAVASDGFATAEPLMKLDLGAAPAPPRARRTSAAGYVQRLARARRADACRHRDALGHHPLRIVQAHTEPRRQPTHKHGNLCCRSCVSLASVPILPSPPRARSSTWMPGSAAIFTFRKLPGQPTRAMISD